MIYLDNGATGGFKPRAVIDSAENVIKYLNANPGRSGHRLSITGANIVDECRQTVANFINCPKNKVIFTKNCTEALNTAIFASLRVGGHIISTCYEHNSVLRPLTYLHNKGLISLDIVYPTKEKNIVESIEEKINAKTYLIVTTGSSNVTGESLPVKEIGKLCKEKNILYLLDGAQYVGHHPIDMEKYNISMLAMATHKGLYSIMGLGALGIKEEVELSPFILGGTGSESFNLNQPDCYPERLESGTLNLPAIASLTEGVKYVKRNFSHFSNTLIGYTSALIEQLKIINGVTCYSKPNPTGIVSFSCPLPSTEVADILNTEYDIAVRGGLHCAPLMHKLLKTENFGLVRASLSVQNTTREIASLVRAVSIICKNC